MSQNIRTASRVQLHAHIEPEVRDELARVARQNDRSLSAETRRAVVEHVERERQSNVVPLEAA